MVIRTDEFGVIKACNAQCEVIRVPGASITQGRTASRAKSPPYVPGGFIFSWFCTCPANLFSFEIHPGAKRCANRFLTIATMTVIRIKRCARYLIPGCTAMTSALHFVPPASDDAPALQPGRSLETCPLRTRHGTGHSLR